MRHTVVEYIKYLKEKNVLVSENVSSEVKQQLVEGLDFNSKSVLPNSIFVMKGVNFKAKFLDDAILKGAIAVVRQEDFPLDDLMKEKIKDIEVVVSDANKAMAILANKFNNFPYEEINAIGITGTKGKSTTVMYLKNIIDTYLKNSTAEGEPKKMGITSGVVLYYGEEEEEPSHLTTPEAITLQNYFRKASNNGLDYFAMEVSSQALKYHRVYDVIYKVGAFLNIGEDHISDIEHKDFADYFDSKKILFQQSEWACINADDEKFEEVLEVAKNSSATKKIVTFGTTDKAEIRAFDIESSKDGVRFNVSMPQGVFEFKLSMRGLFNVTNALCAITIASFFDIPVEDMQQGLLATNVEGRMETFASEDGEKTVIVDYAHNEMSYNALFDSIKKEYPGRDIFIIFGVSGNRSFSRREKLGKASGRNAKMVYMTEADYGTEPLEKILRETSQFIAEVGGKFEAIPVRGEAIYTAMDRLSKNDILVVAGKGREKTQTVGTKEIPITSDVEYVEQYLESYNKGDK